MKFVDFHSFLGNVWIVKPVLLTVEKYIIYLLDVLKTVYCQDRVKGRK